MIDIAVLGFWLAGQFGSAVTGKGISLIPSIVSQKLFARKFNKRIEISIDDILDDKTVELDSSTVIDLKKLKSNIKSIKIANTDFITSEMPFSERKKKTERVLRTQLKKDYNLPDPIISKLVNQFVSISSESCKEYTISSDRQFKKETSSSLRRIEEQVANNKNNLSDIPLYDNYEYSIDELMNSELEWYFTLQKKLPDLMNSINLLGKDEFMTDFNEIIDELSDNDYLSLMNEGIIDEYDSKLTDSGYAKIKYLKHLFKENSKFQPDF